MRLSQKLEKNEEHKTIIGNFNPCNTSNKFFCDICLSGMLSVVRVCFILYGTNVARLLVVVSLLCSNKI